MTSFRLLPIVLVAITALFLLKSMGLLTNGGYTLLGVDAVVAQSQLPVETTTVAAQNDNTQSSDEDDRLSTIEEAAAKRAADELFEATTTSVPGSREEEPAPVFENSNGEITLFDANAGTANSKDSVLQRLSERRFELDSREQALELQEGLVAAAEIRLNERIANLEAVEARVQALLDRQDAQEQAQFDALVSMYANMKSSDAANVFNSLNMDILLRLATKMSPRKMSPILADMSVERAQQLTIQIATAQMAPQTLDIGGDLPIAGDSELPQIVGQ